MKNPWQVLLGRERLSTVFWGYCVLGAAIVIGLPNVGVNFLMDLPMPLLLGLAFLQGAYLLWAHVSLWTCAFNVTRRTWGYAARGYVLVLVLIGVAGQFMPASEPRLEVRQIL